MILHGRNMIVKVDGTAIACARSCELTIEGEMLEVANTESGKWKKYIPGRKGWSVSLSNLVSIPTGSQTGNIRQALNIVGTTVTLSITCNDSSLSTNIEYTGTAVCTQSKITGTLSNLAQGSFSFQGNGELYDISETDVYCKGILDYLTGGTEDGLYLMEGRTTLDGIKYFVLNDRTGEELIQTFLTPNTTTIYHVGDDSYKWNGNYFSKITE